MIFRTFTIVSIVFLACIAVAAQKPTPSPTPTIQAMRVVEELPSGDKTSIDRMEYRGSFEPKPVTGRSFSGKAVSLNRQEVTFEYHLPEPSSGEWYTCPDPTGTCYLIPMSGICPDIHIGQEFFDRPADSLESAIEKITDNLKWVKPVIEDLSADGLKGRVFSYSMPPAAGVEPHYLRTYVFSFNNSLFNVTVGSASQDRMEWVKKSGDEFVKSFRVK